MTVPPAGSKLPPEPPSAIITGLRCRCPRCGKGKIFSGLLTIADSCPVCGLDLRKEDSGDGPAVFVIFILGAVFMPLVFWVEFAFAPPWWLHMLVWSPLVVALALALLRPMKGVLIALQFRHHASDSGTLRYDDDDDVRP